MVGETIPYISPEEGGFRKQLAAVGLPQEIIDMVVVFSLGIANEEFNHKTNDLETVLGRPTQSIADFLKETYA